MPICLQAQSNPTNSIEAKIVYIMITQLRGNKIEQPAELMIKGSESIFIHSKGKTGLISVEVEIKQPDGSILRTQDGYWQDTLGSIFYKNFEKKQLIIREIVWMQPYLAKEPRLPTINWQIFAEQRKIGKFQCQKAQALFRGRNYTAWFAPEIPLNDGPWKLQGLPGLILEVYDDTGEVKFLFSSIDIPSESPIKIISPTNGLKVSFKDYKKADDLEFEKMKRKSMSVNSDRSSATEVKRVNKNLIEKEYEQ